MFISLIKLFLKKIQAASVSITMGTQVWVEDPDDAWIDGEVVEVNGDTIKVQCTSGKMVSDLALLS